MYRTVIYRGEEISVPGAHAKRLVDAGKAEWPGNKAMKAEDDSNPDPKPDLKSDEEISERTGKPKRKYKRRDMKAED